MFIDDAIGQLLELWFVPHESFFGYCEAARHYFERCGKPLAFYSEKHGIFRVNQEQTLGLCSGLTQFGRAMQELDIQILCANSPQAKGQVERANQTLQDRLVKELRLRAISDMQAGNAFYCSSAKPSTTVSQFNLAVLTMLIAPCSRLRTWILPDSLAATISAHTRTRPLSPRKFLANHILPFSVERCAPSPFGSFFVVQLAILSPSFLLKDTDQKEYDFIGLLRYLFIGLVTIRMNWPLHLNSC